MGVVCIAALLLITAPARAAAVQSDVSATSGQSNTHTPPRISMAAAENLALGQVPGVVISEVLGRNRSGVLVYSFQIKGAEGVGHVVVNAMNGEVSRRRSRTELAQEQAHHRSKMNRREWHNH